MGKKGPAQAILVLALTFLLILSGKNCTHEIYFYLLRNNSGIIHIFGKSTERVEMKAIFSDLGADTSASCQKKNIAREGTATQIDTYNHFGNYLSAPRAINGDTDGQLVRFEL